MVEREVIWTETASRQLHHILEYWLKRNRSPEYPKKILQLVDEYIGYISKNPESYRLTDYKKIEFVL